MWCDLSQWSIQWQSMSSRSSAQSSDPALSWSSLPSCECRISPRQQIPGGRCVPVARAQRRPLPGPSGACLATTEVKRRAVSVDPTRSSCGNRKDQPPSVSMAPVRNSTTKSRTVPQRLSEVAGVFSAFMRVPAHFKKCCAIRDTCYNIRNTRPIYMRRQEYGHRSPG